MICLGVLGSSCHIEKQLPEALTFPADPLGWQKALFLVIACAPRGEHISSTQHTNSKPDKRQLMSSVHRDAFVTPSYCLPLCPSTSLCSVPVPC